MLTLEEILINHTRFMISNNPRCALSSTHLPDSHLRFKELFQLKIDSVLQILKIYIQFFLLWRIRQLASSSVHPLLKVFLIVPL